jgi:branched-chain amino acid transport system substrate-binding protein
MSVKITSLFALLFLLISSCSDDCSVNTTEYPDILDEAVSKVYSQMNIFNGINSLAANSIAATDLSGESIYPILENMQKSESMIDESSFIDINGTMKFIKPDKYKHIEGSDISGQAHVMKLHETLQPVMSVLFLAVEGFYGIDFAYPIFQNGELIGSLSQLFKPHFVFQSILEPLYNGTDNEIFIAQKDGIVIFDQDEEEIGKNITSDPSYTPYPGLIDTGKKIIQAKEGNAEYSYLKAGTDQKIFKKAYWKTVEFFGAEWRVVVAVPN